MKLSRGYFLDNLTKCNSPVAGKERDSIRDHHHRRFLNTYALCLLFETHKYGINLDGSVLVKFHRNETPSNTFCFSIHQTPR